jgi:hypothetical protein
MCLSKRQELKTAASNWQCLEPGSITMVDRRSQRVKQWGCISVIDAGIQMTIVPAALIVFRLVTGSAAPCNATIERGNWTRGPIHSLAQQTAPDAG